MMKLMKSLLLCISVLSLGGIQSSKAARVEAPGGALTVLKQVQIGGGDRIDLLFDRKIKEEQIKVEFFGEIVQLVIQNASVYPAKISSVSGGELTKVFAYQYAPKVVRARFTVKGKAEELEKRFLLTPKGKVVTIQIQAPLTGPAPSKKLSAEEETLLARVKAADAAPPVAVAPPAPVPPPVAKAPEPKIFLI